MSDSNDNKWRQHSSNNAAFADLNELFRKNV
jgi:hypothetical protein